MFTLRSVVRGRKNDCDYVARSKLINDEARNELFIGDEKKKVSPDRSIKV